VTPGYRLSHARVSLGIIRMIDPGSEVIGRILNFVGIPTWEEVVVSSEVRANGAKDGLQSARASTATLWVRDLELVF